MMAPPHHFSDGVIALFALFIAVWVTHAAARNPIRVVILYPGDQVTVFDNDGEIGVQLIVSPVRNLDPDDRVELFLDGRRIKRQNNAGFVLTDVGRGKHRLRARIVAANGQTIANSRPVLFDMWRASGLAPDEKRTTARRSKQ